MVTKNRKLLGLETDGKTLFIRPYMDRKNDKELHNTLSILLNAIYITMTKIREKQNGNRD